MNYEQLAQHRTVLLDLYTSLDATLGKEGKRVDPSLRAAQKNIAAEKFLLAIVGEVKAGKSTFINALLGEAILPYDALQATSEIIEIDKSDKKEVRVTFANGTERVVEDDPQTPENEAVPFLKKIVAVKEEYRDIPIVQVNKFLMDHYNERSKQAVFSERELMNTSPCLRKSHLRRKIEMANGISTLGSVLMGNLTMYEDSIVAEVR